MFVHVVLINPIEDDDSDEEEKRNIGDIENVEGIEVPNCKRDH